MFFIQNDLHCFVCSTCGREREVPPHSRPERRVVVVAVGGAAVGHGVGVMRAVDRPGAGALVRVEAQQLGHGDGDAHGALLARLQHVGGGADQVLQRG